MPPLNTQIFDAAYSGAFTAMCFGNRSPSSIDPADYDLPKSVAFAFALAIDTAWNSATAVSQGTEDMMQSACEQYWTGRSSADDDPATYAPVAKAIAVAVFAAAGGLLPETDDVAGWPFGTGVDGDATITTDQLLTYKGGEYKNLIVDTGVKLQNTTAGGVVFIRCTQSATFKDGVVIDTKGGQTLDDSALLNQSACPMYTGAPAAGSSSAGGGGGGGSVAVGVASTSNAGSLGQAFGLGYNAGTAAVAATAGAAGGIGAVGGNGGDGVDATTTDMTDAQLAQISRGGFENLILGGRKGRSGQIGVAGGVGGAGGGAGGAGGAGGTAVGVGGDGGGCVIILAPKITFTGTVTADVSGTDGTAAGDDAGVGVAAAGASTAGGGGGGGGASGGQGGCAGFIFVAGTDVTGSLTPVQAGGAGGLGAAGKAGGAGDGGGAAGGTGGAGSDGIAGTTGNFVSIVLP